MRTDLWADVRPRIARRAGDLSVFGARSHKWVLEPVLTEDEVAEIEAQYGIDLPTEYRSFLLEVSRGGAGPYYGLNPVDRADGRWRWSGIGPGDHGDLGRPFPHVASFDPESVLPPQPSPDDDGSLQSYGDWIKLLDAASTVDGVLWLCHQGCGYLDGLVVTGPARGQMWHSDLPADGPIYPLVDDRQRPVGFARWFRDWLDQVA